MKKLRPISYLFLLVLMAQLNPLHAQDKKTTNLRSRLIDGHTKEPLIYASIYIKGSRKGCHSDVNGYFNLAYEYEGSIEDITDTLMINYIGYESIVIPIKDFINKKWSYPPQKAELRNGRSKLKRPGIHRRIWNSIGRIFS
ncbi:MAG: carboxypeptidase-like regulatory domain-containing protein [Bacteroidota bacterium]